MAILGCLWSFWHKKRLENRCFQACGRGIWTSRNTCKIIDFEYFGEPWRSQALPARLKNSSNPYLLLSKKKQTSVWMSVFSWQRIQKWIRTFFNFRQGELQSILLVVQIKYCVIVIQNHCINKVIYQRLTLIVVSQICHLWPFKKFLVLFTSVFRFCNLLLCDFYFNILFLSLKLFYTPFLQLA